MIHPLKLALVFVFSMPLVVFSQQTPSNAPHNRVPNITAKAFFEKGELLIKNKDLQKAYPVLKKSLNLAEADQDWALYIKTLNALASINSKWNQDQQNEIFSLLKKVFHFPIRFQDNEDYAQLHFNIANQYHSNTYAVDTTIYHYKAALKIWIHLKGEWNESVAACYHRMGDINKFYKNDFFEAERCYEKALQIREKIQFKDEIELARNYYGLAVTNRSQRDFEKALSYGTKTLELSKKLNSAIFIEMTSYIIANIYRDMGNPGLAKEYYFRAIAINKSRNDPEELAYYYMGLAETLKNEGLLDESITYFKKALTLSKNEKLQIIYLLNQMAETCLLKKDYTQARQAFNRQFLELEGLKMMKTRHAYHGFTGLGDYEFSIGQNDSAIFYYQKAIASVTEGFSGKKDSNPTEGMIGYNYYVHGALSKKAKVLTKLYIKTKDPVYLQQSLVCLTLAEKLLSRERNTLDMEDSKWNFLQENFNVYEEIVAATLQLSMTNPHDSLNQFIFHYIEQSKARTLSDALIQTEQANEIKGNDSILRVHQEVKRKLFQVEDNLNKEIEKKQDVNTGVLLRQEIVVLDRDLQKIKSSIEKKYPGYFGIKYGNFIPSLQVLQKSLKSKNQIILEYFWGNEYIYALGISSEQVMFERIGSADSVRTSINGLLSHFSESKSTTSLALYHSFVSNSHAAYKILAHPFRSMLTKGSRLQIIPDGLISQLPFEILINKAQPDAYVNYRSLPYLIKNHAIGYAYSSATLRHNTKTRKGNPSLLAMGFTNVQGSDPATSQLQPLAGSESELKTLAIHFSSGKFLKGYEVTESNFKMLSPDFDILHLAIHGTGETEKKYAASLHFRTKSDSAEDGELHAFELYGLKLKAKLAVLSSCESGLGKDFKGEGMMSMANGFTYAGCENVLMSLWKVNDQISLSLMDNFYSRLMDGQNIDDALSEAKLNYLDHADELTADPRIWASLVVYGKLNPVFEKKERSRIFIVAACIFSILLLGFALKKRLRTTTRRR